MKSWIVIGSALLACATGCADFLGVEGVQYKSAAITSDAGSTAQAPGYSAEDPDGGASPATSSAPDANAPPGTEPDAGATQSTPDADVDAGSDAAVLAECRASACAAQANAKCGAIPATCGGLPVDCGACAVGTYCGDDGHANQCGYFCQDTGLVNFCPNSPAHAFNFGCTAPYWLDSNIPATANQVFRPGGTANCIYHQASANLFLLCCP